MEWEGIQYKVLDKLQVPVKLGKGAFQDRLIKEDAYSRGLAAIIEFKGLIASYHVDLVEAYGTSALRNASNAPTFIKEAESILGYPIRVIDGALEAELIYSGVKKAVPLGSDPSLIMDIGGGSVEFIIANNESIFWKKSYEIGAARLIEQFAQNDPMDEASVKALENFLEKELAMLWIKSSKYQVQTLVGASGSFESLASIEMEVFHSATQAAHFVHHILDLGLFEQIFQKIRNSTREEIAKLPGLPQFRVEMITIAVIMIRYVLHRLKIKKMIASDYALKEGVMFRIMDSTMVKRKVSSE
jgi:exopolyphosphatase/guanosine-5'-triphosphate,3'-diphosphate pyrophosphatase